MHASSSREPNDNHISALLAEKKGLRRDIEQAIADQDDVLAAYEQFVKWLDKHERDTSLVHAFEILEVLEEGVRTMKDDQLYKRDLRYVKLWTMYARRVRKPEMVYAFLFKNAIGTSHSQLYEECALVLEEEERIREAEDAYKIGLKKSTRAVDRLKSRFREFQDRVASGTTLKSSANRQTDKTKDKSTLGASLYRDPLQNFSGGSSSASTFKHSTQTKSDSNGQANGAKPTSASTNTKRGERLHVDLSLLQKDGVEMSIQEARAASLGLLGRQWGPPPHEEMGQLPHSTFRDSRVLLEDEDSHKVSTSNEDDLHTRHLRLNMRVSMAGAGEPTVTINTKEALKDVFGMYNSPDKTTSLSSSLGSKLSSVRKVEPVTPAAASARRHAETPRDENQPFYEGKTPGSFRLFVDDEMRKENATPAPSKKLSIFCDDDQPAPLTTPASRPALAIKQNMATPSSSVFTPYEDDDDDDQDSKPTAHTQVKTVFSRVFTPVNLAEKTRQVESSPSNSSVDTTSDYEQDIPEEKFAPPPPTMPVFSRPPSSQAMQVFEDKGKEDKDVFGSSQCADPSTSAPKVQVRTEPVFRRKSIATGRQAFVPHSLQNISSSGSINAFSKPIDIDDSDESVSHATEEEDEYNNPETYSQDYYEDEVDNEPPYEAPMGGRLGRFDVMTPIAERTIEYTMSTRAHTPTHSNAPPTTSSLLEGTDFLHSNASAAEAAKRLALELQEDEDNNQALTEEDEREPEDELVERTCNLSLADAIVAASSFKPPNPCVPTDPKIISTLLSMVPHEPDFFDLIEETSGQFDDLQRFAAKLRRNSGKSTSSKSTTSRAETCRISLGGYKFDIVDKLGEGGFGAVFTAKEAKSRSSDDEDSDEEEDDDDDDETGLLALKVVKPRNIWEYHILRRVHSTLSSSMRASIISPHALYAFRDESFLVMDICTQGTLLDVVNRASQAGVSQQGGCLDELLVMFFSIELLRFMEAMHSAGFIHGDLKIDNCLVRLEDVPGGSAAWSGMYQSTGEMGWKYKGIKMIDFGRTIDTRMFPSGQQFISDWKADVYDCLEMRQQKPWTFQTDYYGLAGIIYCMLFGKHIEATTIVPANFPENPVRYKLAPQLKRYWQVEIWTSLFDILLNPTLVREDGSMPVVPELTGIRVEMETWLSSNCNRSSNTLKGLLKKVERCALTGLSR